MSTATARAYRSRFAGRFVPAGSRKSPEIKPFCGYQSISLAHAHCIKDRVLLDPCCGTAGFLLASYEHMRKQSKDVEKQKFLKNNALYGADNTSLVVTLVSKNLYLHDISVNKILLLLSTPLVIPNIV